MLVKSNERLGKTPDGALDSAVAPAAYAFFLARGQGQNWLSWFSRPGDAYGALMSPRGASSRIPMPPPWPRCEAPGLPILHLREIVDRQWLVEFRRGRLHSGYAGAAFPLADALSLDKGAEDSKRQVRMPCFDGLIEPVGQLALAR